MSMFGGGASPSLADIAAVTRNNDGNDNNGFGGNNGWWVLVILFALFGGWGNGGGWGNNRGNSGSGETTIIMPPTGGGYYMGGSGMGFAEAAVQRGFDNQSVIQKLDGINSGICSLGYDQLAQMNGINTNVMTAASAIQGSINQMGINNMKDTFGVLQAINNNTVGNMQNTNTLTRQIGDCCCENRAALADIKYIMTTESCATNNNIHQTGDAIINNQNQNFQMLNQTIKDGFCNLEMREMQRENQNLRDRLSACDRDSALMAQSRYLLDQLNPCAKPSYIVQNPNCCSPLPVQVQGSNGTCSGCFGN